MPDIPARPDSPAARPRAWLEENVGQITRIAAQAARRHRLPPQDRQELLSIFWTHLAKDDYRVLRQFRGSSGIGTYLRTVVDRVVLDMRTALWGKWRPSARAKRLGPGAQAFERLVERDGHPPAEARELLRRGGASLPTEIEAVLVVRTPPRRRRFVSLEAALNSPSSLGDPFTILAEGRDERRGATLAARLERALTELPSSDQVLIRMRHEQGLKVSQIATMIGVDQKKLYRRLDAIHADLRVALTGLGVCPTEALALTSGAVSHVPAVLSRAASAC